MCKVIDADCVLANMFARGWTEVEIKDLNHFREKFEIDFNNVFIDVSGNTICLAVDQRPDMFKWVDDVIRPVAEGLFTREYVNSYFNWRIPEDCREPFLTACIHSSP